MNQHYTAVLADLRERRLRLEGEMRDIDAAIGAISKLAGVAPVSGTAHQEVTPQGNALERPFARISVRWATLWHLSEFASGFEKTGQIANALKEGGYETNAAQFGNMVSAVLSTMKTKGEVETNEEGGYRITPNGRHTWELIKQGAKFRSAVSSEPPLLSVQ